MYMTAVILAVYYIYFAAISLVCSLFLAFLFLIESTRDVRNPLHKHHSAAVMLHRFPRTASVHVRLGAPMKTSIIQRTRCFSGMSTAGLTTSQIDVREGVGSICKQFPDEYWAEKDQKKEYAGDLHRELAKAGYIGICMPEDVGGVGMGIAEATIMMQTISESGAGIAGAQTIHANVYATVPILRFGTTEQKKRWLPSIISGDTKVCFGVTEPNTGLDTLRLQSTADRKGNGWVVNGQKIWITNAQSASRMVLLARTTPLDQLKHPSDGLSLFYADLAKGKEKGQVHATKIPKMGGNAVDANQVFMDGFEVSEEDLTDLLQSGEVGQGFKIVLHGMNAERCLLAGEALGLGYAALKKASTYAATRNVFGRPIGQNQGIAHPLASSWCELEAGKMLLLHSAKRFDEVFGVGDGSDPEGSRAEKEEVGAGANAAKWFCAETAFKACERAVMTHGEWDTARSITLSGILEKLSFRDSHP